MCIRDRAYMPYDAIINVCQALNPMITDLRGYILFGVVPFNLIKGTVIAALTVLLYGRLAGVLSIKKQPIVQKS